MLDLESCYHSKLDSALHTVVYKDFSEIFMYSVATVLMTDMSDKIFFFTVSN